LKNQVTRRIFLQNCLLSYFYIPNYKGQKEHFLIEGEKGEMAEACGWIFVDHIPLLYDKRRVARQYQVEMWLDLTQLVKELGIEKLNENNHNSHSKTDYVV
jgi:hypothetical protein